MVAAVLVHTMCIILICNSWSHAEVYSALSDCESLLDTQRVVIKNLEEYVQRQETILRMVKKKIDVYKKEHKKALEDVPNYLGNPINVFTLIKRLTVDLKEIDKKNQMAADYIINITMNEDVIFPTQDDLVGAAEGLTRLKSTYDLEVKDLAEGIINGVSYRFVIYLLKKVKLKNGGLDNVPFYLVRTIANVVNPIRLFTSMSASDFYVLGRESYNIEDFTNALSWMLEAYRKYAENKNEEYFFTEADIMDYIILSYYSLDDLRNAIEWTKKLFAVNPKYARTSSNVPYYEKILYSEKLEIYKALCREEMEIPQVITKRLTCFYLTENHPFLRWARIKAEKRYIDPDVYIFHDVMSDDEIEHVKSMAKHRFERAKVFDRETGKMIDVDYRISKYAWLNDEESDVIARISQRISDFTGLSMDSYEDLQVVNYGIGGHYTPHYDFRRKHETSFKEAFGSNRMATVMFYMSEVAQGGATVFTELGLRVFPIKNAALFWMNLHPSGEGDLSTRHAACPVLRGSKWVSNKWIRETGQEFSRPCSLEYQQEEIVRKILHPVQYAHILK